jgi:hypothetical protein
MKKLLLLVLALLISTSVFAHQGGRSQHGGHGYYRGFYPGVIVGAVGIGLGYRYYEPPVYYVPTPYQPMVIYPSLQVFWYCVDLQEYYPNVTTCPSPWQKVIQQLPR